METQNNPIKLSQSESNGASQKGNTFLIIVIIVGVITIGIVGFTSWKYFGNGYYGIKENQSDMLLTSKEKSETIDEKVDLSKASATEDWKTYQNEEYGFEIKYPKDWYSRFTVTDQHFEITNNNDINNNLEIRTPLSAAGSAFIDIPFDENIFIADNISAKKKTELIKADNYEWQRVIIQWEHKNGGVIIYDYPYVGIKNINYSEIFNQILSTFKFINPVADYFENAELQRETEIQKQEIFTALNDILNLSEE